MNFWNIFYTKDELRRRKIKKEFDLILKSRTRAEWEMIWDGFCLREVELICKLTEQYMVLPTYLFFPTNELDVIFILDDDSMDEVELLDKISRCFLNRFDCYFEEGDAYEKIKTFGDFLGVCKCHCSKTT